MTSLRTTQRRLLKPISILLLLGLLLGLPALASAHPLDQYIEASYVTVAPGHIVVELDMSPGVLIAPQILPILDSDGNGVVSDAEGQAYANVVLKDVALEVDGTTESLVITSIEMPEYNVIQSGYGTIRIFTDAKLQAGVQDKVGIHTLSYTNTYQLTKPSYQVNAFVEKGALVTLGAPNRDSLQESLTMDYSVNAATTTATTTATITNTTGLTTGSDTSSAAQIQAASGTTDQVKQLLGMISDPNMSFWVLLAGLGLAALLGGLHALTPGHGKALVASYLVGSRGTTRHAIALGGIITLTHTSSVILIGLLALFAGQFIVPSVLVPSLEIGSGLLVVVLGGMLIMARWRTFKAGKHLDEHDHGHDHTNGDHAHPHTHSHALPSTEEGIKRRDLVALGISGGIVPCPEALGVMLIAISLNKLVLGLGLIVAFSLGLALVLIALGIILVRARSLANRLDGVGGPVRRFLPLASALIVTVLGLGIIINAISALAGWSV